MTVPCLKFVPNGVSEGFRASAISAYNNVDPDTIVRELIQNALDAAHQIGRYPEVRFELESISTKSIPAYQDYVNHFNSACRSQKKLGTFEQARPIADAMRTSIESEHLLVLWVVDNGIGLNRENMQNLLGDGQSQKFESSSAGSYGNGHVTVFPASNLRYIIYGGVFHENEHSQRIVAGHTMLATHQIEDRIFGKDGFLVNEIQNDLFEKFDFYDGSVNSQLINKKLDWIEKNFETGACVGILGFNQFNREEDVVETIQRVAAVHFLPAIYKEEMKVEVFDQSSKKICNINRTTLKEILDKDKHRVRRRKRSIGPSGEQMWAAYETLSSVDPMEVDTKAGKIAIYLRQIEGGGSVQLFRNGMWITNDLPYNRPSDLGKLKPFSAVLLLSSEIAPKACDLVRQSEGPRHIDITLARLSKESSVRRDLEIFLCEVRDFFKSKIPQQESEEFDPGFFLLNSSDYAAGTNSKGRKSHSGKFHSVPKHRPTGKHEGKKKINRKIKNPFIRQGNRLEVTHTAVRQNGALKIVAISNEDADAAELRIIISSGADETCDRPEPDDFLTLKGNATINTASILKYQRDQNNKTKAIVFGPLKKGTEFEILVPVSQIPSNEMQIEFVKRSRSWLPNLKKNSDKSVSAL